MPHSPPSTEVSSSNGGSRSSLWALYVSVALDLFAVGMMIPLFSTSYQKLGISATTFGLIGSVYGFAQFAFNPIIGRLSDTHGRKRLLLFSFLGSAVSYLLLGFAKSVTMFLISRIIVGVVKQTSTIATAWISDSTSEGEERVTSLARLNTASYLGFLAGPALGGWLLGQFGTEAPAVVVSLIFCLNFVMSAFLLPDDTASRHHSTTKAKNSVWSSFFHVFKTPQTLFLLSARFALFFAGQLDHSQYSLYMVNQFNATADITAYIMSYSGFISAITNAFLLRPITARFRMRTLLTFGLLVQSLIYLSRIHMDLTGLLVTMPLFTLASVLHSTLLLSTYSSTFSSEDVGIAMGIEGSVHSLARIFGPTCGGLVMDLFGYPGLMTCCGALGTFGLLITFFIRIEEKNNIEEVPKSE